MIIRPSREDDTCSWSGAEEGAAAPGHGTLRDAAAEATGPVTVLAPGTDVLTTRVRLPVRSRSRARTAVPWALEDRLADEVENLHFALGSPEGDHWPAAVIAHGVLRDLLGRCEEAGLDVQAVVPEPLALPMPASDAWTVLEEADWITVRMDADQGFSCEPELLAVVAAGEEQPARIEHHRVTAAPAADWPATFTEAVTGAPIHHVDAVAAFSEAGRPRINLLQGPFARNERRRQALRRWALPAGLAAALVLMAGIQAALEYRALGERQAELREQIQTVYARAFPDARETRDPRSQMQSRLRQMRGSGETPESGFPDMLLRAGRVIDERDGARLGALTWRSGALEMELSAGELPELDAIQRSLGDAGLNAELRGVDRQDERVHARLRITEEGA